MDEIYKSFSDNFYNRLKNTINASINCKVKQDDSLYIEINRFGVQYKTSVKNVSKLINNIEEMEKEFNKVIKRYRMFIEHKFFYS